MMEAWRTIPGTDGRYEVSDKGRVRSCPHTTKQRTRGGSWQSRSIKPRIFRTNDNGNGYQSVMLRVDGRSQRFYVHRLVLEAFVGPPPTPKHQHAAHWDGDTRNNTIENLRWATVAENSKDKIRHGVRRGREARTHCPHGHPYSGDNVRTHSDGYQICVTCARQTIRNHQREETVSETRRKPLPASVRKEVYEAAGGKCQICSALLDEFQVDHILAIHLGGGDEMQNLRALCIDCHKAVTKDQSKSRAKVKRIQDRDGLKKKRLSQKDKMMAKMMERAT